MAAESQLIHFAPKKSVEQDPVRNAASADVLVNGYRLRVDGSVRSVYKFELKFFLKYASGREHDLSRGPKNDVGYEQKRWLLWELFQTLISSDDAFFGNDRDRRHRYVYDCGINFYARPAAGARPLLGKNEERRFEIPLESLTKLSQSYIGRRVQEHRGKAVVDGGDRPHKQEFLEILSSQMMISEEKHHIFPQKMYERDSAQQLQRDPRVLKSGMQKSLRFVGDSADEAEPFLQIDPKKAAFFPTGPLGLFLEGFLPPTDQLLHEKIYSGKNLQVAIKQLKNLVVRTNHLDVNHNFAINGLTDKGANETKFDFEGDPVSVFEYFKRRYTVVLRFPELPCVVHRRVARVDGQSGKVDTYYPIEVLEILDGQRVSILKQTPTLVEQMIRQCQALPCDFQNRNEEQRSKAFIAAGNPYFKAFGRAPAQLLHPPTIVYANNGREEVQHPNLPWRMTAQRKYLQPAIAPQRWAAVIFAKGVQGGDCKKFLESLVQIANNRGFPLTMPDRYDEWDDISIEFLRERLTYYRDMQCTFAMFFTRDKLDPAHDPMKFLETETGVKTQNISAAVMQKGVGQKGAVLVLENVLMKMNLKWGGVNYGLSTSMAMRQANSQNDVVAQKWLSTQRMIIGIDLSHSGPQSLYERQSGQPVSNPTVIGVSIEFA
ncbi:NRDE-3 protein [Aphelenchoides avenae]|nr:NRDE-3 protein [Aphelenchus avenae]